MQIHNTAIHSADYPMSPLKNDASNVIPNELNSSSNKDDSEVRAAFDKFVGETFYGQMLKSMRTTLGKPAYFHGGRAEEIFQSQLDQIMVEEMTQANANSFTDAMYHSFNLKRV